MSTSTAAEDGRPKRGRAATRPAAVRHAAREASRRRLGLTANNRGQTKLPAALVDAVRSGKATASHTVAWAVVELACALGEGRCTAAQSTLADAVGTSTPRLARLLADNSPLLANLDGRGPLMAQERQERGLPTRFYARRKGGQLGGWAPTWSLTLVCDGTSHEQLVPARLISPSAWLLYAVLVWWAGDEGSCRRYVRDIAAELGASERLVREWTRELRAAGLLLVRDRRGDSRKPGVSTVSASTYIPVVVRRPRPQGQERDVVAVLRRLPGDLPLSQAWTLDRLDPSAGLTSSQPGRVGFGGWAAWRVLAATGPVACLPVTLADTYGVPEETASQWAEEAFGAGLVVFDDDPIQWRAVLAQPTTADQNEVAATVDSDRRALLDPDRHGLLDAEGCAGDVVTDPPATPAQVVIAHGPRPPAGAGKVERPRGDIARVLGAPEVRVLLLDRMNDWQRRAAERKVADALSSLSAGQLSHRVTAALVGKSPDDIREPYGWLRQVIAARYGCTSKCTCVDPACEAGVIWYDGTACRHCEREREDRIASAAADQPAVQRPAERPALAVVHGAGRPDSPPSGRPLADAMDDAADTLPREEAQARIRRAVQAARRLPKTAGWAGAGAHVEPPAVACS
ncbi:hypothetical protein ACGF3G_00140 [Streptomyces sp. NPDC048179]|uniref:hypothetical protein n=1 Tax=Streptomyces sp. NPDC048179 TaxID=3365506 RepID=UPI0037229D75